jgi:hypothetical protein
LAIWPCILPLVYKIYVIYTSMLSDPDYFIKETK